MALFSLPLLLTPSSKGARHVTLLPLCDPRPLLSIPTRYQTTMTLSGVPTSRVADEWFLYLLLQNFATRKDSNAAHVVYEVLLPHLAGKTLQEVNPLPPVRGRSCAATPAPFPPPPLRPLLLEVEPRCHQP